ncbi:MAG: AAA-like domain-containing protein [Woeseiaceae bacterium]
MADTPEKSLPETERSKVDSTGEFFSVGQPLHAVRAGYISRAADETFYDTVAAGRYAHVIAPDRSGKSSLVAAAAVRLTANGAKVAILDLQQISVRDGGNDAGRWYYSVAYRLLRQLRIRFDLQEWWHDKSILSNRQRLVEFYSEVILGNIQEQIVVFVDEIQCIGELPFADQLLASIRAAHNARTTDPDFQRLTFALFGECDPAALIEQPELSPFAVTQPITLADFSRDDLDLFGTELGLDKAVASAALDRIYFWTDGQPYLTQKLARAIARDGAGDDVTEQVDSIAAQQLIGRAAIHSEPHMSHIHRRVVNHPQHKEALLNLYGKIRKGIEVQADLGSPLHRFLLAIGLVSINEERCLEVRNRCYAAVFTARWANENLPAQWRGPAVAAGLLLVMLAIPFWYTQLLPSGYVDVLTSPQSDLQLAHDAHANFRSFPGHAETADGLYRRFLETRASIATDGGDIVAIAAMATELPNAGRLPEEMQAAFWDRKTNAAMRAQSREEALLASLQALVMSTPQRRQRAAMLVADDLPLMLHSQPFENTGTAVFDPVNMTLTKANGAVMSQWRWDGKSLVRNEDWSVTALEVTPLVRRVILDQEGSVARIGLTLNISHPRQSDLRIKVIAPSGRTVEVETGIERASSTDDIRIDSAQLRDLQGEQINGTWSLSVRDEALGVAGHLVGWNLKLNSQGVVEDFERGLNIPDPIERETDNLWFSKDGRYAIARAMQSDSARIWDLAFAAPVRAVAVGEGEQLIGLDAGARHLLTATQETVNVWNTSTGDRVSTLPIGAASSSSQFTADGMHLFVQRRGDTDTAIELWSLESSERTASISVAGTPALVASDASGSVVAVADYDRAVRVWHIANGELLAQISLDSQPSEISLAASGDVLGVVSGNDGFSLWSVPAPQQPLLEKTGRGPWRLLFSPSGSGLIAGTPALGYQVYRSADGSLLGPALGPGSSSEARVLAFSGDEQTVVTGSADERLRFWRVPVPPAIVAANMPKSGHMIWTPAGHGVHVVTPDARMVVIGDRSGDVHILPVQGGAGALAEAREQVSFLGHNEAVKALQLNHDGTIVASAAADNTVRLWNVGGGDPRPFSTDVPGNPISHMRFAPDSSMLAVLNGNRAQLLDTISGELLTGFDLAENHEAIAFATPDRLYLGAASGALRVLQRDAQGGWSLQTVWQGSDAIRLLEASPDGAHLAVVAADNTVSQFDLVAAQPGGTTIRVPEPVTEVRYSPNGKRLLLRTSRWVHRARSSSSGLRWSDTAYGPDTLANSKIVFGAEPDAFATRFYLPQAGAGFVQLAEVSFAIYGGTGLFGTREELLAEWQRKLLPGPNGD